MSRLKNLLISEGVPETSARRKIADLETGEGCLVKEEYGSLKLNQKSYGKGNEGDTEHG